MDVEAFSKMSCSFPENLKMESKGIYCEYFCNLSDTVTLAYNKVAIAQVNFWFWTSEGIYLELNPTVPYFGTEHVPFAILAIVVLSTFIALPPLLLIAYPIQ